MMGRRERRSGGVTGSRAVRHRGAFADTNPEIFANSSLNRFAIINRDPNQGSFCKFVFQYFINTPLNWMAINNREPNPGPGCAFVLPLSQNICTC
jgi:hypothetical protein